MEEFSGATSTSIEQEFFINLLLSNIASLIKASADEEIDKKARSTNRFRYQANRAYIIGRLKWFFPMFQSNTYVPYAVESFPSIRYAMTFSPKYMHSYVPFFTPADTASL
jgi:hypothetical protein